MVQQPCVAYNFNLWNLSLRRILTWRTRRNTVRPWSPKWPVQLRLKPAHRSNPLPTKAARYIVFILCTAQDLTPSSGLEMHSLATLLQALGLRWSIEAA